MIRFSIKKHEIFIYLFRREYCIPIIIKYNNEPGEVIQEKPAKG